MEENTPAGGRRLATLLRRNQDLLRHWVVFLGVLGLVVAVDEWAFRWINYSLAAHTAEVMAWILRQFGIGAVARETFVYCPVCRFEIIGECTGYYLCGIFLAAVLASPCRWSRRLLGIGLGIPAILALNQVRLVSLCFLSKWYPEQFETLHMVVWQSLMLLITIVLWLVWAATLARGHEPAASS